LTEGTATGAEFYDGKTVTYVVATAAGAGYDGYGRLTARYMEKHLPGSTFVVVNRPGAGHLIGTNLIYNAKPDGLTLGTFNMGVIYSQITGAKAAQYDLGKMSWIGKAASDTRTIMVAAASPYKTFDDLRAAAVPVLNGDRIEPGCHVVNVGGGGRPDDRTLEKVDVYLRFGNAPAPWGLPEMALEDEYVTYAAEPEFNSDFRMKRAGKRGHGAALPDRMVTFKDIFEGTNRGRASSRQITYSERGNLQGAQFWAVGGVVYEKARDKGLGHEIPTEWPLQDIRD
jgi:hypothetical protein